MAKKINTILIMYFKKEFNFYDFLYNKFYSKINNSIDNLDYSIFLKNYNYICCDALELLKPYLKNFASQSKNICKISMPHGSDFPYHNDYKNIKKNNLGYNFKIILFSKTKEEKNYYQAKFKLKDSNYFRIGNPKHDKKWIKKITKDNNDKYFYSKKKYVFLISRHSDREFFSSENKIKTLKIIKKMIVNKKKYNLIIKLHPKEQYKEYYYDIFDKKLYNRTWKFSNDHPYNISKNAFFSLSFFSGVATDMNISGTPNIEFLSLKSVKNSLKSVKNPNHEDLFFKKNIPMFRIRYLDLTLGVDNEIELEKLVELIEKNKKKTILFLQKNYYKHYVSTESTKKIIKIFN